jgi:hypothetical protein
MADATPVAARLIGRRVIDAERHPLGVVIAVIHRASGVDVLVEGRRWWLARHSCRFRIDDITLLEDGRLLVRAVDARLQAEDLDVTAYKATGAERR